MRRIAAGQSWRDLPYLDVSAALPRTRRHPNLTSRQEMVLRLICDGLSNKEISGVLGVSSSSVKCTIQQLFEKTNVRSRSKLVRVALENMPGLFGRTAERLKPSSEIKHGLRVVVDAESA